MSDEQKQPGDRALEALVGQLARNQPLRRAPDSLEHRVLAQLAARRGVVPWWRQGFSRWPLIAQAAFVLASIGFVTVTYQGMLSVMSFLGSREAAGDARSWVQVGTRVAAAIESAGYFLLHTIPPTWLYAGAALALVSYALLFGLGTVAYRTLYVER